MRDIHGVDSFVNLLAECLQLGDVGGQHLVLRHLLSTQVHGQQLVLAQPDSHVQPLEFPPLVRRALDHYVQFRGGWRLSGRVFVNSPLVEGVLPRTPGQVDQRFWVDVRLRTRLSLAQTLLHDLALMYFGAVLHAARERAREGKRLAAIQ